MIPVIVSSQIKINTHDISARELRDLERICTVKNPEYYDRLEFDGFVRSDIPKSFAVYEGIDDHIYLPRGALEKAVDVLSNVELIYQTSDYDPLGLKFAEEMEDRDYQNKAVEAMLSFDNGILVSPTGSGKTNIMAKIIQKLDQPTLILVHRNHLLKQWKSRIQKYLGYTVGIIGSGSWKVKNITVAMIPTLHLNPERMVGLRERFGLVIIDECHHIPAFTWISNIIHLGAHHIYGCSATPKRKDRLQQLMYLAIGPIRHIVQDRTVVKVGAVLKPKIKAIRTPFQGWLIRSKLDFSRMMPTLIVDKKRNSIIINQLIKEPEHKHLVLSDRIQHLKILQNLLKDKPGMKSTLVIGETALKRRDEAFADIVSGEINVIFASSVADEGLDIPSLDRLHLTFPTANPDRTMQQIGRIRRPAEGKTEAIVYDYFDWKNRTLNRQFQARKSKYSSNGFEIQYLGEI